MLFYKKNSCRITLLLFAISSLLFLMPGFCELSLKQPLIEHQFEKSTLKPSLQVEFQPEVIEALNNGVPLSLQWQLEIVDANAWPWTKNLWQQQGQWQIQYRPLSQRYIVSQIDRENEQSFVRLSQTLSNIEQSQLPLPDLTLVISQAKKSQYRLRVSLLKSELPPPLRLLAYVSDAWTLDTGWITWDTN